MVILDIYPVSAMIDKGYSSNQFIIGNASDVVDSAKLRCSVTEISEKGDMVLEEEEVEEDLEEEEEEEDK